MYLVRLDSAYTHALHPARLLSAQADSALPHLLQSSSSWPMLAWQSTALMCMATASRSQRSLKTVA